MTTTRQMKVERQALVEQLDRLEQGNAELRATFAVLAERVEQLEAAAAKPAKKATPRKAAAAKPAETQ